MALQGNSFQEVVERLRSFWSGKGCLLLNSYNSEVGAGTFNPATFFNSLGPKPFRAAYVEPSSRPTDGRYGENPNRLQQYFQFQVILKPSPDNCQDLYMESLQQLGIDLPSSDIRFVEDDWKSPTLGANGIGWEVRFNGMEISQFTYFQQMGGVELNPITVELTYGLERVCMIAQQKENAYQLDYGHGTSYKELFGEMERQFCHYNFSMGDGQMLFQHFDDFERQAKKCFAQKLFYAGYHGTVKCSHLFNLLDAGHFISVTQRVRFIERIRHLATLAAKSYLKYLEGEDDLKGEDGKGVAE